MTSIFPSRGCVFAFKQGGSSAGFFALNPSISSPTTSPVLILGASLEDPDVLVPRSTLDGFRIVYSFGPGFGSVNILGVALLGNENGGGKGFASVMQWFQQNRASAKKKPVQLSLPGKVSYNVLISGLAVGQTDPRFNTQQFMLGGIIAETPVGGAGGNGRKDGFLGLTSGALQTASFT